MIGSFWNLCRACPSMPVDKVSDVQMHELEYDRRHCRGSRCLSCGARCDGRSIYRFFAAGRPQPNGVCWFAKCAPQLAVCIYSCVLCVCVCVWRDAIGVIAVVLANSDSYFPNCCGLCVVMSAHCPQRRTYESDAGVETVCASICDRTLYLYV